MSVEWDVGIVGAGPAGAWAACRLASAGARVVLIDGSHPREKPCGGGVTARALAMVAPAIAATLAARPVATATFAAGGRSAGVDLPRQPHGGSGLVIVSRAAFDGALLEAAQQCGAEHVASRVTSIDRASHGWNVTAGGTRISAAWIVGADGANSFVRRRVASPFPRRALSIASGYFVRDSTAPDLAIDFEGTPTGYVWSFPRVDHMAVGACGQADATSAPSLFARAEQWIATHLPRRAARDRYSWPIPSLNDRALAAERPAGDRWMLAGDAAGLVDPITREGIYFALLSGEHAAHSLQGAQPAREYTRRLHDTAFGELRRAARLKSAFFRPELLALLVKALNRSAPIRSIMADLICGTQPYAGLRRRLLGTLELRLMVEAWRR